MQDSQYTQMLNYEPQEKTIEELVVESLKNNYRDYIFSQKDKQTILDSCKKNGIELIYIDYFDKYGDFDYTEFIPVTFKKSPKRIKPIHVNITEIKTHRNRWQWVDLSKRTTPQVIKNRENSSKR